MKIAYIVGAVILAGGIAGGAYLAFRPRPAAPQPAPTPQPQPGVNGAPNAYGAIAQQQANRAAQGQDPGWAFATAAVSEVGDILQGIGAIAQAF